MKRTLILILIILNIFICFLGCSTEKLTTVKLNEVTHSIFYAPQYVAINEGFFEDEGLKIELTNGQGADKVMTAVLSGQADIGFCGPEAAIYVHNEGRKDHALVFAQLTKRDGSFLLSRKYEENFNWNNLKGKLIIGGRKGGMPEMTLEYVLKQNDLIPGKDVEIDTSIQFALMAGAFTGGKGDYVTLFEPTASMLEKEHKGYIVASIGKESGEIPYTAYLASKSYIENNKDIVEKFTNAIYRGQLWVKTHSPEEIAKAIKPSFPDADDELLTTVVKRYKEYDTWKTDPNLKEEDFELLQEIISEAGELSKKAPYENIVTQEFSLKAIENIK